MDLTVVCFLLLPLLSFTGIRESQALWYPKNKYPLSLSTKDNNEDIKRRRKHARRMEPISLKPPPQGWPEPAMVTGDFVVEDQSKGTTVSPLLAYQAKLEQEYIMQQQKEAQESKKIRTEKPEKTVWTSSEEELRKLLDPNELLKHNKQLKPIVNQGKPLKSIIKKVKIPDQQIEDHTKSLTETKDTTKTAKKGKKIKAESAASQVTTKRPPEKRKRRKSDKSEEADQSKSLKKRRKRKLKSTSETKARKTTKRKKRVRKFAFAHQNYEKIEEEITPTKSQTSVAEISKEAERRVLRPNKIELHGTPVVITKQTNVQSSTEMEVTTVKTTRSTSEVLSRIYVETNSSDYKAASFDRSQDTFKKKIRERRKEIKQELKNVLKAEELKGSFEDRDSHWNTSEEAFYVEYNEIQNAMKRKVEALKRIRSTTSKPENMTKLNMCNVTPHHALLGIIKQTIIKYIDKILKKS